MRIFDYVGRTAFPSLMTGALREGERQLLDKTKFVVPRDLLMSQLLLVVRRRLHMRSGEAVFLFDAQRRVLMSPAHTVAQVADRYADPSSGVVYLCYAFENTFG